jgi:hypothetical protein
MVTNPNLLPPVLKANPPQATVPPKQTQPTNPSSNSLKDLFGGLQQGAGVIQNLITNSKMPELTAEQRAALQRVHDMLGENKLGGADRIFNFADLTAIANGLRQDIPGLVNQIQDTQSGMKERIAIRTVTQGVRGGPIRRAIRERAMSEINTQFFSQVYSQLAAGLTAQKIDPNTGKVQDLTTRTLTIAELQQFEQDAKMLQTLADSIAQKTGFKMEFPNGVSQSVIADILAGRIPQGGKLVPVPKNTR